MNVEELEPHLSKFGVQVLMDNGISRLFPPQKEVIKSGLFTRGNFVISIPTASGKTLLAELVMVREIMEGGKCLYIVPLRALAVEKFEEFRKWEKIGLKIGYSIGDYESKEEWLGDSDIVVTTSEKADSFLRNGARWIRKVTCLVVDEIHLIDSGKRGPVLEILINKFRRLNPDIRVIALSATIPNAEEIAEWLKARLYVSDWRPTELFEGVYLKGTLELFSKNGDVEVREIGKGDVLALTLDCLKDNGQVLIFDSTRRNAEATASRISTLTMRFIDSNEDIAKLVLEENEGDMSQKLADCIRLGSAFHHAGLLNSQRRIVENAFKGGRIKVVVATPTLAAGVNLPARRVIVKSYHRFEPGYGSVPIKVLEYKQMAGRAGRPGLDPRGEAILIAKSKAEKERIIARYMEGELERIESKLGAENHLRFHTLSLIAEGFVNTLSGLEDFFAETFFFHQNGISPSYEIQRVINQLERWNFIEIDSNSIDYTFAPTELGSIVSKLYIDPMSGFIFSDTLSRNQNLSEMAVLHLICRTPDMESLFLRKSDDWIEEEAIAIKSELTYFPSEYSSEYEWFLSEIKTALCIYDWINERDEDVICEKYNISPGDIRRIVETAEWLIYSLRRISNYLNHPQQSFFMSLESRIKYGVKGDLVELVELKSIGRVRARKLSNMGIRSKEDLLRNRDRLPAIIGKKIAEKILNQIEHGKD
jgi:helicase